MKNCSEWCRWGWLGGLIALVLLGLAGLEWFDPFYFCYDDNATQHGPWMVHNYRTLSETGELAWMNFHQMLGHSHFLAGQSGVLYWPNYLCGWIAARWIGLPLSVTEVTSWWHLLAATLAMYAWLRTLEVQRWLSACGSMLYLTSPFLLILSKAEVVTVYCAFYFPAILACLEWYLTRRQVRFLVGVAVLKALLVYQGNVQFFFLYMLVEVVYLLGRWMVMERNDRPGWSELGSWLFSNVAMFALILPLVWPMQWAAAQSKFRSVYSPADALAWRIDLVDWVKAQVFCFEPQRVFDSSSALFYLGGMVIVPVLVWWRCRLRGVAKDERWVALMMTGAVSFFLSTLGNVVLSVVPFYNLMRWPYKWYQPVVLFYAALMTVLLSELVKQRKIRAAWAGIFLGVVIISNVWVTLSPWGRVAIGPQHFTPELARKVERESRYVNGRTVALGAVTPVGEQSTDQRLFNFSTAFAEFGFTGYDGFVDRKTARQVFFRIYGPGLIFLPLDAEKRTALNEWSVRYWLVAPRDERVALLPGVEKIGVTPSGMIILENRMARPFAWVEDGEQALPVYFAGNRATIQVSGQTGTVIISVLRLPGWTMQLDAGQWQPVLQETGYGQMRVSVPPGTQQLTLRYFPPPLKDACFASLVLLVFLTPAWLLYNRRLRRH